MPPAIAVSFPVLIALCAPGSGQEPAEPKDLEIQEEEVAIELSAGYKGLSDTLEEALRRRELFEAAGISFGIGALHLYPAQMPGPYLGPPLPIWSYGFGASLWRDPITGRPLP